MTGVSTAADEPRSAREPASGFLPELEGLRGVAILLVVLFHAHLLGAPSGFIGVDVFFVLSGFLITGLLVRELEERGSVDLARFYVRRARRILPASLVIIALTMVGAVLLISPLDVPSVAADAAASALSAGNIRFALRAVDYFAQDQAASPLLHYWSLGVEEQFYLVWPALFAVMAPLARRSERVRIRQRLLLGVILAAGTFVSLVAGIVLTSISQPYAFYLLPTRAWELGLGGLLAVAALPIARVRRPIRQAAGWVGLVAVVASAFLIDLETPYPGIVALLPTLASALVIVSAIRPADEPTAAPWPLETRPLRFLGLISFSLYLVHWPIFILAEVAWRGSAVPPPEAGETLEPLPIALLVGLVVLSVVVAAVSYRLVERPFHKGFSVGGWSLARVRPRWVLSGAVLAMAVVVAGSLGTRMVVERDLDGGDPVGAVPSPAPTPVLGGPQATPVTVPPSVGPGESPPLASSPPVEPTPQASWPPITALTGPLPDGVRPRLRLARDDWDLLYRNGCALNNIETRIVDCVHGDPNGTRTMALVGDSHAEMWFPALDAIAKANHWRLVPLTKFSCRFFDLPMFSEILKRPFRECEIWKEAVLQRLNELRPDLTIVVVAHEMTPLQPEDADPVRQGRALARYLERFPGEKAVIVDGPESNFDVPACLASHRDRVEACQTPRRDAADADHALLEQTATEASGALLVDMTDRLCTPEVCPAVIDRMIVYRDNQHLTATYAEALAPVLEARLWHLLEPE
ncbi:MAG TPA: acyltransferase family protein [Candidatus Binatia bacterium]|nr:acyltransferase family protein [Candidatus Binatia bacterium]